MSEYHHQNLDNTFIEKGIELINQNSIKNFSLRELSTICNVSHNAIYRHYESKEAFIDACRTRVCNSFLEYLEASIKDQPLDNPKTLGIFGLAYIDFFKKNPSYYRFIYDDESSFKITLSLDYVPDNFPPFEAFRKICVALTTKANITHLDAYTRMVRCWAIVQGVASLLVSKNIVISEPIDEILPNVIRGN